MSWMTLGLTQYFGGMRRGDLCSRVCVQRRARRPSSHHSHTCLEPVPAALKTCYTFGFTLFRLYAFFRISLKCAGTVQIVRHASCHARRFSAGLILSNGVTLKCPASDARFPRRTFEYNGYVWGMTITFKCISLVSLKPRGCDTCWN